MDIIQTVCLFILLAACSVIDVRYHRIPNVIILAGIFIRILSMSVSIFAGNDGCVMEFIGAMILFAGISMPLYLLGMLGAGDVKLFGMTGFYIGLERPEQFLAGLLVSGGLLAAGKLLIYGRLRRRMKYLWTYIKAVCLSGQVQTYEMPAAKEEVMGLSGPVLFGIVCWYLGT